MPLNLGGKADEEKTLGPHFTVYVALTNMDNIISVPF